MSRPIRLQGDSNAHDRPWRVAVEQGFFKDEGLDVQYRLCADLGPKVSDPIYALAVGLLGHKLQPKLLAHNAGKEPAHRMRLPAGAAHDAGDAGAARTTQQDQDPRLFRVRAR